jgi:hypothetical protein
MTGTSNMFTFYVFNIKRTFSVSHEIACRLSNFLTNARTFKSNEVLVKVMCCSIMPADLALLQGTYQSPLSINNIIPLEDYSKEIKPIINNLIDDADTEYFANGMFQKNNWKDEQIVPTITPRFQFQRDENFEEIENILGEDPYGNDVYQYQTDMFESVFDTAENQRLLLTLSPMFDMGNGANSDFVKVPRVFVNKRGQNVDLITGRTISSQAMKAMRMQGNTSLTDYYGYQKVKYSNGQPLLNFEGRYVYKLVNLLGDGNIVSEYYLDGRPSVLNNGTIKIDQELSDAKIIGYFDGNITEDVVSLPAEVTEPIVAEEVISPEEQLEFEVNDLTRRIEELESLNEDLEVSNVETIVLNDLPKITPESARKETGVRTGNKQDISTSLLSKDGISVEAAADLIWNRHFVDTETNTQDVRNIIIDILSSGSKTNYASQIGVNNELADLKQQLKDLQSELPKQKSKKDKTIPGQLDLFEQEDDSWKEEDNNDSCVPF